MLVSTRAVHQTVEGLSTYIRNVRSAVAPRPTVGILVRECVPASSSHCGGDPKSKGRTGPGPSKLSIVTAPRWVKFKCALSPSSSSQVWLSVGLTVGFLVGLAVWRGSLALKILDDLAPRPLVLLGMLAAVGVIGL